MAVIKNKKTWKIKNLTKKDKYILKTVRQSLIKQAWRLKDKSSKIN